MACRRHHLQRVPRASGPAHCFWKAAGEAARLALHPRRVARHARQLQKKKTWISAMFQQSPSNSTGISAMFQQAPCNSTGISVKFQLGTLKFNSDFSWIPIRVLEIQQGFEWVFPQWVLKYNSIGRGARSPAACVPRRAPSPPAAPPPRACRRGGACAAAAPATPAPASEFTTRTQRINRNVRGFGREMSSRGRFATPADHPLHDCSPCRGATRTTQQFGICPSLKGHFLSPRA